MTQPTIIFINIKVFTFVGNIESLSDYLNSLNHIMEDGGIKYPVILVHIFFEHQPDNNVHLAALSQLNRSINKSLNLNLKP